MNLKTLRLAAAGAVLLALVSLLLAACGGDDKSSNIDIASAINIIDGAGMHSIDDSVNEKKEVPPTAQTTAVHLQTVLLTTQWPSELKDPAKKLAGLFGTMATTLDSPQPDLAKAGPAVRAAHDAYHDFSQLVWDYLAGKAGLAHDSAAHGH